MIWKILAATLLLVGCGSTPEADQARGGLDFDTGPMRSGLLEDPGGSVGATIYGEGPDVETTSETSASDTRNADVPTDVTSSPTPAPARAAEATIETVRMPDPPSDERVAAKASSEPEAPIESREARIRRGSAELLELLRAQAFESGDPARWYLGMAALEAVCPGILAGIDAPDHDAAYDLSPAELDAVLVIRNLLNRRAREQHHDPSTLEDQLRLASDELANDLPVRIRRVDLCRAVLGYGNFEPFESHRFRAGRANQVIVYTEVDRLAQAR
ncbi:MAG: hypothetical protein KDA28_07220, partial [Phycisphaerales bacterium]|nr:hypothetical protein [Phycisphaerales bacterium]